MNSDFGPWSTSLGPGWPQSLSTFWVRRMARLAEARARAGQLTRRDWLRIGAGAAPLALVPTLRTGRATEPGEGPGGNEQSLHNKIVVHAKMRIDADDAKEFDGMIAVDPDTGAWERIHRLKGQASVSPDGSMAIAGNRLIDLKTAAPPRAFAPPRKRRRSGLVGRWFPADHGLQHGGAREGRAAQEHLLDGQRRLEPHASGHSRYRFGRRLVARRRGGGHRGRS